MHMNVKISAKLYEEMRKYPLFFVKLYGKISYARTRNRARLF